MSSEVIPNSHSLFYDITLFFSKLGFGRIGSWK